MTLSTILLLPQLIIGSYTSKGNPGIEVFNWDSNRQGDGKTGVSLLIR
jgi:hypothetical protein